MTAGAALCVLNFLNVGCVSNDYVVGIYSDPSGAMICQDGIPTNRRTPYEGTYHPDAEDRAKGNMPIKPLSLRWPSGARSETIRMINLYKTGGTDYTFTRPNVPGLEIDLREANAIEDRKVMREANSAAARQARVAEEAEKRAKHNQFMRNLQIIERDLNKSR